MSPLQRRQDGHLKRPPLEQRCATVFPSWWKSQLKRIEIVDDTVIHGRAALLFKQNAVEPFAVGSADLTWPLRNPGGQKKHLEW